MVKVAGFVGRFLCVVWSVFFFFFVLFFFFLCVFAVSLQFSVRRSVRSMDALDVLLIHRLR